MIVSEDLDASLTRDVISSRLIRIIYRLFLTLSIDNPQRKQTQNRFLHIYLSQESFACKKSSISADISSMFSKSMLSQGWIEPYMTRSDKNKKSNHQVSRQGIEPWLSQPQCEVLTTIRSRPTLRLPATYIIPTFCISLFIISP